jgi:putative transposase
MKRLRQLCNLSSKLWNEVNYARLRMFLEKKSIDFEGTLGDSTKNISC